MTVGEPSDKCTPEQAKVVWESIENPTYRGVAKKLGITHVTLMRWHKGGWKPGISPQKPVSDAIKPLSETLNEIGAASRKLAVYPKAQRRGLFAKNSGDYSQIMNMTDDAALKQVCRIMLATIGSHLRESDRQRSFLMRTSPRDLGAFIDLCGSGFAQALKGFDHIIALREHMLKAEEIVADHDRRAKEEAAPGRREDDPFSDLYAALDGANGAGTPISSSNGR